MTEEEKKAIEILKNVSPDDLLDCWDYGEEEYDAIQTILNLIEKQNELIKIHNIWEERKIIYENKQLIIADLQDEIKETEIKEEIYDKILDVFIKFDEEYALRKISLRDVGKLYKRIKNIFKESN